MMGNDPLRNPEPLIERVYSYAAYRLGGRADPEEVTSATFERAVRYRASYDPIRGTPLGWVLGIARRCVDDALASARTELELGDIEATGDLEVETIERLELESALAQLDAETIELLSLRYGADLSSKAIAELLDSTPGAVRVALHRAHARLRGILEEGRETEAPGTSRTAEVTP